VRPGRLSASDARWVEERPFRKRIPERWKSGPLGPRKRISKDSGLSTSVILSDPIRVPRVKAGMNSATSIHRDTPSRRPATLSLRREWVEGPAPLPLRVSSELVWLEDAAAEQVPRPRPGNKQAGNAGSRLVLGMGSWKGKQPRKAFIVFIRSEGTDPEDVSGASAASRRSRETASSELRNGGRAAL
jgi:hypothetical protein